MTERQRCYILALIGEAGFQTPEAGLKALMAAGRELHPSSNAAFVMRAWDAGRRSLDTLTRDDASKVISGLKGAMAYDNPAIGIYRTRSRS